MISDAFVARLDAAVAAALEEGDVELALEHLTALAIAELGDEAAVERPGALKAGERDYRVSGGFPPEQRRLSIPIAWNHPGAVVETQKPLLLENTDEHSSFRQFLKSSRMGSSIYVPMFGDDGMFGQIVVAAQVRWTYRPEDLAAMSEIAAKGETLWRRFAGAEWLKADYPAPDVWDASVQSIK